MVFLPIADRELRVNARKRTAALTRVFGALVALAVMTILYSLELFTQSFGRGNLGSIFFSVLTWLTFAAALGAGLFLTADCLSEEKREGTLGLLFLTDLRGYDVVFGKFLSASLQGFYALLAIFPIVAVTFLLGGVTGAAFWQAVLALLNALFVSLAVGLFVSTVSRDSLSTLVITLLSLLAWVGIGPLIDSLVAENQNTAFTPVFSISSPGYVFAVAGMPGRTLFWRALLLTHAIGWLFFALSCALVGRTWQDRQRSAVRGFWRRLFWKRGGPREGNPLVWLTTRERWQSIAAWCIAAILIGGALTSGGSPMDLKWFIWSLVSGAAMWLFHLGIASLAARAFVDARRTGFFELLLAAPLTTRDIVRGQWLGFLRVLSLPILLVFLAQAIGTFKTQEATARSMAATMAAAGGASTNSMSTTTTPGGVSVTVIGGVGPPRPVMATISVLRASANVTNIVALIWFGMWMGLTSRNSSLATLKTIVFVLVIPWFFILVATGFVVPFVLMPKLGTNAFWYPVLTSIISTALYLGKDLFFILWARRRLYSQFRERVAGLAPVKKARSRDTMVTTVIPNWGPQPGSGG